VSTTTHVQFLLDEMVPEQASAPQIRHPVARFRDASSSRAKRIVIALVCAWLVARVLAVDLAGIVTNDSLGYLGRAEDPFETGFIAGGYRQAGYPLIIAISNRLGDVAGWDHIFGVAAVQRSGLVASLVLLAWSIREWSIPVALFATSSTFIVLTDFVLTEGLVIPACIASGALLGAFVVGRITTRRAAETAIAASCALAMVGAGIKLQYASLLALTVAIAWLAYRDRTVTLRWIAATLGIGMIFVGSLGVAQSLENRAELGTFEPIAERQRSMWWGAWQAVFALEPQNADDPALAYFYDGGDLYKFLHGLEGSEPDYHVRRQVTLARVDAMFDAAGTSSTDEYIKSFLGALHGGRSDDLSGISHRILAADAGDALTRLVGNSLGREAGADAVINQLNDGERPGIMTTGPVFDPAQRFLGDYRDWISPMSMLAIVIMLASLFVEGRHRTAVLATLVTLVAVAAAMAAGYTDNSRYLVGPLTIVIITGTLAARAIVMSPTTSHAVALLRGEKAASHGAGSAATTESGVRPLEDEQKPESEEPTQT
jgi:hypothetical protein